MKGFGRRLPISPVCKRLMLFSSADWAIIWRQISYHLRNRAHSVFSLGHHRSPADDDGEHPRPRETWIDVAKGVGIFLVVFEHVVRGLVAANVISATPLFRATDYTIYLFHMPLFFFLSGLTARLRFEKRKRGPSLGRLLSLVYVYFFWSFAQLSLQLFFYNYVNYPASPIDFVRILYAPTGQFWFLYALLLCHLVFLMAASEIALMLLAVAVAVAIRYLQLSPLLIVSITAYFLIYYAAGNFAVSRTVLSQRSATTLMAVVTVFAIAAAANWALFSGNFASPGAVPAAFLGIAAVIIASQIIAGPVAAALAQMGRCSLTIFVAHVIVAAAIRALMLRLGIPHNAALYIVCGVAGGIVAPMALHLALARFGLLPLFGLAPFRLPERRARHTDGTRATIVDNAIHGADSSSAASDKSPV
jgi:fucose 4-O-acetylase-like acetyltransferase